jgi:lipopolysaccharide transport system ATP-binding protein
VRQGGGRQGDGVFAQGDAWWLEVEWESQDPALSFQVGVGVDRVDGVQAFSCDTRGAQGFPRSGALRYRARLTLPELPLVKGEFSIYVFLLDEQALHVHDRRILTGALRVESPGYRFGIVAVAHRWEAEDCRAGLER